MSFKKNDKKSKKSPGGGGSRNALSTSPPSSAGAGGGGNSAMPEGSRAKLLELFGQIEQQFELMHCENVACEFLKFSKARAG